MGTAIRWPMPFIDHFTDAANDLRQAENNLAQAQVSQEADEALRATIELAGARIAFAILAAADLLGPAEGTGLE